MAGLTLTGFEVKTLEEIKAELEVGFKSIFGDEIDLDSASNFGQLIGNEAKKFSTLWEALQGLYSTFSPDFASGISLDNVAAMVNVFRLGATSSLVEVVCFGDQGIIVTSGSLVSQSTTGEQFSVNANTTIDALDAVQVDISIAILQDSTLYSITINGTVFDFTSDASATAIEIMAGLKIDVDAGAEPVIFTDNLDGTATIQSDDFTTPATFVLSANLQFDSIGTPVNVTASNTGVVPVPALSIDTIVTAIANWNSVSNLIVGSVGRGVETDEEFRIRRKTNQQQGFATDEAIRSAVLTEVDNVTAVTVISNRLDVPDGDGRPAHSFETIVEGGTNADIADKIWATQPSGIQPYGSITEIVVDSQNNNQTVKFSRPVLIYIWVDVTITLNSEEDFPANGSTLIEEAIVEYGEANYEIGDDVIYQELNVPIFSVPGIASTLITLATSLVPAGPPGAYSGANVAIATSELAAWDTDRIVITVV